MSLARVLIKGTIAIAFFSLCAKFFAKKNIANVHFIEEAAARGIAEIEAAKLALEKAVAIEVKEVAQHMFEQHVAANKVLMALSQRKSIPISEESVLLDKAQDYFLIYDEAKPFDISYAHHQLTSHKEMIALFRVANKSHDADIRDFAAETLPILEHHLQMIRQLISNIASSNRPQPTTPGDLNAGQVH